MIRALCCAALVLAAACQKPASEPPRLKAPEPLPRLLPELVLGPDAGELDRREALFKVEPLEPGGSGVPGKAARLVLEGTSLAVGGAKVDVEDGPALRRALEGQGKAPVLVAAQGETWVTHAAPLFAALDDLGLETWLLHPDASFAYRVTLRDPAAFGAWLDEPVPGKVRVIQRADGFELTTGMGKVLAADPNGPSVPVRGGAMDLTTLRTGLSRVKGRFKTADDLCFMPSFGTPLADAIRSMAANWAGAEGPIFGELCFVYPRPVAGDGGQ